MTDKVIFLNSQGFLNKEKQLNEIVERHEPIVLLIAEHFQCNPNKLDKIVGYKRRADFCRDSRERGGVAVYVKDGITFKKRPDLDALNKKNLFEIASVEIPSRCIVVTAVYRPPKSSKVAFNKQLRKFLDLCNQEPGNIHLMGGDFNIDTMVKNEKQKIKNEKQKQENSTEKVLGERGFQFMLSTQTHDYGSCLDNFIVDFKPSTTRVLRQPIDKLSDHHPIELILPSSKLSFDKCSRIMYEKYEVVDLIDLFVETSPRKTGATKGKGRLTGSPT